MSSSLNNMIITIGKAAKNASHTLAIMSNKEKVAALLAMANAIRDHHTHIQNANETDLLVAREKQYSDAFIDRLTLNSDRIEAMAKGLEEIAALPDPVGKILAHIKRPNGLEISRISVPIGVIAVIYESRPNVTADAAALCLKSGNAVILRGGSESFHSVKAIISALHEGLKKTHFPQDVIQMIPTPDRAAVSQMLSMDKYIDVIIPRGGQQLIEQIAKESRIPLFKHLSGLCHTYIHEKANLDMARNIIKNAKMRRTGICGATEVLLIDKKIASTFLPVIINDLIEIGCEIRGEDTIIQIDPRVKMATESDYDTEFLDAILAIKIIPDLHAAIKHISEHSTHHTDAIITDDIKAAETFLNEVDSAIVMHNASTQFADGGEFGMGGEIGIATGKLHARGPVGVEQLTTFKYIVHGSGQVRS